MSTIDNKINKDYTTFNSDGNLLSQNHYQPHSSINKLHRTDLTLKDEYIIPFGKLFLYTSLMKINSLSILLYMLLIVQLCRLKHFPTSNYCLLE